MEDASLMEMNWLSEIRVRRISSPVPVQSSGHPPDTRHSVQWMSQLSSVCVPPLSVASSREISAAQDRFTDLLESIYREQPSLRELTRMVMMTVGRGGQGDVGQRIRDEILVIQRANNCMGGIMEQWHQKLHNNTSPDDVVLCEVRRKGDWAGGNVLREESEFR